MNLRTRAIVGITLFVLFMVASWGTDVIPADPPLRWWKGNLHTHTLWSDGDDFPEMVAEWYRTRNYNFLSPDHNVLSQGQKWMKRADVEKRGGAKVLPKYVERFGKTWIEERTKDDVVEIRLLLDEFRRVEERGKFIMIPAEEITDKAEGVPWLISTPQTSSRTD